MSFDIEKIRSDFPILNCEFRGKKLVYLDNAATTQKPSAVIDGLANFYREHNAPVHRVVYALGELSSKDYDSARSTVQKFINAKHSEEIIFMRGTTDGINFIAQSYGRQNLKEGDEILITQMEHHSNIVPWQILAQEKKLVLRVAPMKQNGELDLDAYTKMLTPKVKLVALTHVSNVLGTINPIEKLVALAHEKNIIVVVDGAQAVAHLPVDVQKIDCDFYVFSGHKIYAPTGIGAVYGKKKILEALSPLQGGGGMISSVTFEKTLYAPLPDKFEAGTPNIGGAVGFALALDYVSKIGLAAIEAYQANLLQYATNSLQAIDGLEIIGTAREKICLLSFVLKNIHPHDVGSILDREGIAVRTGHHCAQPLMDFYQVPATTRASLSFYNTKEEIDALCAAIRVVQKVFK